MKMQSTSMKTQILTFMEIRPVGASLYYGGRTEGQT